MKNQGKNMATGKNPSGGKTKEAERCFVVCGNNNTDNEGKNAGVFNFGNCNTEYVGEDLKTEKRDKSRKDPKTEKGNSFKDYKVEGNKIMRNKSGNAGVFDFGNSKTQYVRKNGETDSKSSGDHEECEPMVIDSEI